MWRLLSGMFGEALGVAEPTVNVYTPQRPLDAVTPPGPLPTGHRAPRESTRCVVVIVTFCFFCVCEYIIYIFFNLLGVTLS